jgi:hypothetical protein
VFESTFLIPKEIAVRAANPIIMYVIMIPIFIKPSILFVLYK